MLWNLKILAALNFFIVISNLAFSQGGTLVFVRKLSITKVGNPTTSTNQEDRGYKSSINVSLSSTNRYSFLTTNFNSITISEHYYYRCGTQNGVNCYSPPSNYTYNLSYDSENWFSYSLDGFKSSVWITEYSNSFPTSSVDKNEKLILCRDYIDFTVPAFIKKSNNNLSTYTWQYSVDQQNWITFTGGETVNFYRSQFGTKKYFVRVISALGYDSSIESFKFSEPSVILPTIIKNNLCSYDTASVKITNNTTSFYNVTPTIHFNKNEYQALTSGDLNNNGTIIYNDLLPGNYTLEYKIKDGCRITKSFTISPKPTALLVDTVSTKRLTCNASQDGEIKMSVSGGNPYDRVGYEFSFDNLNFSIQPDLTFTNLKANNHTLYVRDKNNCMATFPNIIISEPKPLQLKAINAKNITCFGGDDGSVTLEALGGNGSYSYTLGTTTQQSTLFTGLKSGSYTFIVTDAKQCSTSFNTSLTQALDFTPKAINVISPSCFGLKEAGFTVSVTGPTAYQYQYKLDSESLGNASVFAGIAGGQHTLGVVNQANCKKELSVLIPQPDEIVLKTTLVNPTCVYDKTGSITALATGGSGIKQYAFEQGSFGAQNSFSGLLAGKYEIGVKDEKGCVQNFTQVLDAKSNMQQDFFVKAPLCFESKDGEVKTITTGGSAPYQYNWVSKIDTFKTADLTQVGAGSYYLETKDQLACIKKDTLRLVAPKAFSVYIPGHDVLCKNQVMSLDAGYPDLKHYWYKNDVLLAQTTPVIQISEAGKYAVKIENETGCTGSYAKEITASSKSFDADFLVSTNVALGDEVVLVCNQTVDQLFWDFDKSTLKSKRKDAFSEEIIFEEKGDYTITMRAYKEECFSSLTRTIHVYDPKELRDKDASIGYKPSLVKETILFPNPALSDFTLTVSLTQDSDVKVTIQDLSKGVYKKNFYDYGKSNYTFSFEDLGLGQGVYVVFIEVEEEVVSKRLIVLNGL